MDLKIIQGKCSSSYICLIRMGKMLYLLLVVVAITGIIYSTVLRKSQSVWVYLLFVLTFSIIMGLNTDNADYFNYSSGYYASRFMEISDFFDYASSQGYSVQRGFAFLNMIFSSNGFEYESFRFIVSFCMLTAVFYIANKMIHNLAAFAILYLLYSFYSDIVFFKWALVELLLFWAVYIYSQGDCKRIKYFLIVFLATSFHFVAIIYIGFLIIEYLRKNKKTYLVYKILLIIGLCMPIYASYIYNNWGVLFELITTSALGDSTSIGHYALYDAYARWAWLWIYGCVLCSAIILYSMEKDIKSHILNYQESVSYRYVYTMFNMFCFLIIISGLYAVNVELKRIVRTFVMCNAICILIYLETLPLTIKRLLYVVAFLAIMGMFCYLDFYRNVGAYNIPVIMTNNLFLNCFDR